ncbi:MAG: ferritin [Planctomycetota bacterium]
MLSETMTAALNKQINAEMYSAYLYQSMATWALDQGLKGLANWMDCQAKEEMVHAFKLYNFIAERGGRVLLTAIDGPPADWDSPVAVAETVVGHEQKVTGLINALVDLAIEEKDHATRSFLNWFVGEQVEEEGSANELLTQLKLAADSAGDMLMIDRELGTRVFTPPPAKGEA